MVAQPAGVHGRRHEVVAERVHGHERREPDRVAEVVAVGAARERRAGGRLGREEARLRLAAQHAPHEREGEPGEVRAAAHAAHDHVGLLARHLHLRDRLLADHRLVEADVVEHRAERVVGVLVARGDLDGLGDRDPERAGRVRGLAPARLGGVARRADHGGAPALHHRAPVGLLVVARADHVDDALEAEQAARERQGGAPLAGAGLGREPLHAGLPCWRRPARLRCSACASRPGRRPRTCSRCAPAYRARARGGARGRAASAATACRRRAPARGSRPPGPPTPPGR